MHFTDQMREKVYRNILKTLKPGGKLLVSETERVKGFDN